MFTRFAITLCLLIAPTVSMAQQSEEVRAKLLEQMQTLAKATTVSFVDGSDKIELVPKPVFRYDDQPRHFIDATMWCWTHQGKPIAFQKIEAIQDADGTGRWGYCFTSFSDRLLKAQWTAARKFRSTEAGVQHQKVPDASPVAARANERRRQLRYFARDFTARILINPRTNASEEMRLLTTPIFEYSDAETKLPVGAVFGYATNGTNPDMLINFEARADEDKLDWHYAPARMTTGGLTVKYRGKTVWSAEFSPPGVHDHPTWTSHQVPRVPFEENP